MTASPARLAILLAAPLLCVSPALAQTPPPKPAPAPADAALDSQKAAFLALPLATRVATQDALTWLGFYNGVSDGDFGARTRDAIVAWQRSVKATPDGALGPTLLQALVASGQKARAAAGFQVVADPATGARIGAPTKLIGPKTGVALDFASDAGGDLAGLYARLSAETPTRKVGYKAMKPGAFFVVSGQDGGQKFYSRYERSGGATPPVRGFTFRYPLARDDLDRVALAVANSFQAFPDQTPAAQPSSGQPSAAAPAPKPPEPSATALFVAPGRALTALKPGDCPNPSVAGKPARFERSDAATGLALLSGDFGAKAEPPPKGSPGPDLVVLNADGGRVAAIAATLSAAEKPTVFASLDKTAAGGPAFDRSGGLAGLVAPIAEEPKRVGGVALAAAHPLIDAEAIGAFLGGGGLIPLASPSPLSVGAIAAGRRTSVAAVTCMP
jgi:hypothetical protein